MVIYGLLLRETTEESQMNPPDHLALDTYDDPVPLGTRIFEAQAERLSTRGTELKEAGHPPKASTRELLQAILHFRTPPDRDDASKLLEEWSALLKSQQSPYANAKPLVMNLMVHRRNRSRITQLADDLRDEGYPKRLANSTQLTQAILHFGTPYNTSEAARLLDQWREVSGHPHLRVRLENLRFHDVTPRTVRDAGGVVYVAEAMDDRLPTGERAIKIGRARLDCRELDAEDLGACVRRGLRKRLAQGALWHWRPILGLHALPGSREREDELHARFRHERLPGRGNEWFRVSGEVLDWLARLEESGSVRAGE